MKLRLTLLLVIISGVTHAQENLRLSEIVNTPLFYNPAQHANYKTFDLFHTSRWIGFTGAPGSTLFSAQINTANNKVTYGGMFSDDIVGAQSQTEISGFYSYTFEAADKLFVDLGVSGGIRTIKLDNSLLNVYDQGDPVYSGNLNTIFPNLGLGASMRYNNWFFSISSPSIFASVFTYRNDYDIVYKRRIHTYINIGRKDIELKRIDGVRMTTSLLYVNAPGAPSAILLKNDWIYKDKFGLTANINFRSSMGFSISYLLNNKYKLLYGYDFATTEFTNGLPNSSQYFMLSLKL
jgi:type IX secretion system PorP/SprF family membrane protein